MFGAKNRKQVVVSLPDPASDMAGEVPVLYTVDAIVVEEVIFHCMTAVASSAANHVTMTVYDGGTGGEATSDSIASRGGASTAWGADDKYKVTPTDAKASVGAGRYVTFKYIETGTVAPGHITCIVVYREGVN